MTATQASTPSDQAVIEVRPSYSGWAFQLGLCKPRVAIDGHVTKGRWRATPIPVPAGSHQVEVWTRYLFYGNFGRSGVVVQAAPGTVTRISWRAPGWAFSQGKIAVTDTRPMIRMPEGLLPIAPGPMVGAPGAPFAPGTPGAPVSPGGRVAVPGVTGGPTAPAGWHPDPSGRHEQRYFDGQSWTEHVSNAGVAGTDPVPGGPA